LESLLFVTKKPLTLEELEKLTAASRGDLELALAELTAGYENGRGLRIIQVAHGYIMGTNPQNAVFVDRLVHSKIETTLTPQSLETLAIIAYKQPITKPELERIRGVYCDGVLETLLNKKLIKEVGRSSSLGRPILYGTTVEFLRHFGLKDLSDLPAIPADFKTALHESSPPAPLSSSQTEERESEGENEQH